MPQKPLELKKENVTSAFLAQCTWRGPFHPHHDEYPPLITTHGLFFLILPSSELLKETLVCLFFYQRWVSSSFFFAVRILHSPAPLSSLLQAFFVISDTLCSITNATEEAERVGMRAPNPQLPGRDEGRDHQQNIEETTLTKGIRQQMDLAIVLNHSEAKQQGSPSIYSR